MAAQPPINRHSLVHEIESLRLLSRVMQDHEACASDLNQKLIFSKSFCYFPYQSYWNITNMGQNLPFNSHLWYQGFKSQIRTTQTSPFLTSVWLWFQFSSILFGKIFWYAQNGYSQWQEETFKIEKSRGCQGRFFVFSIFVFFGWAKTLSYKFFWKIESKES